MRTSAVAVSVLVAFLSFVLFAGVNTSDGNTTNMIQKLYPDSDAEKEDSKMVESADEQVSDDKVESNSLVSNSALDDIFGPDMPGDYKSSYVADVLRDYDSSGMEDGEEDEDEEDHEDEDHEDGDGEDEYSDDCEQDNESIEGSGSEDEERLNSSATSSNGNDDVESEHLEAAVEDHDDFEIIDQPDIITNAAETIVFPQTLHLSDQVTSQPLFSRSSGFLNSKNTVNCYISSILSCLYNIPMLHRVFYAEIESRQAPIDARRSIVAAITDALVRLRSSKKPLQLADAVFPAMKSGLKKPTGEPEAEQVEPLSWKVGDYECVLEFWDQLCEVLPESIKSLFETRVRYFRLTRDTRVEFLSKEVASTLIMLNVSNSYWRISDMIANRFLFESENYKVEVEDQDRFRHILSGEQLTEPKMIQNMNGMTIESTPEVLVFGIARKIGLSFDETPLVCDETLIIKDVEYRLIGNIEHLKNYRHYIAKTEDFGNGNWFVHDDSSILKLKARDESRHESKRRTTSTMAFYVKSSTVALYRDPSIPLAAPEIPQAVLDMKSALELAITTKSKKVKRPPVERLVEDLVEEPENMFSTLYRTIKPLKQFDPTPVKGRSRKRLVGSTKKSLTEGSSAPRKRRKRLVKEVLTVTEEESFEEGGNESATDVQDREDMQTVSISVGTSGPKYKVARPLPTVFGLSLARYPDQHEPEKPSKAFGPAQAELEDAERAIQAARKQKRLDKLKSPSVKQVSQDVPKVSDKAAASGSVEFFKLIRAACKATLGHRQACGDFWPSEVIEICSKALNADYVLGSELFSFKTTLPFHLTVTLSSLMSNDALLSFLFTSTSAKNGLFALALRRVLALMLLGIKNIDTTDVTKFLSENISGDWTNASPQALFSLIMENISDEFDPKLLIKTIEFASLDSDEQSSVSERLAANNEVLKLGSSLPTKEQKLNGVYYDSCSSSGSRLTTLVKSSAPGFLLHFDRIKRFGNALGISDEQVQFLSGSHIINAFVGVSLENKAPYAYSACPNDQSKFFLISPQDIGLVATPSEIEKAIRQEGAVFFFTKNSSFELVNPSSFSASVIQDVLSKLIRTGIKQATDSATAARVQPVAPEPVQVVKSVVPEPVANVIVPPPSSDVITTMNLDQYAVRPGMLQSFSPATRLQYPYPYNNLVASTRPNSSIKTASSCASSYGTYPNTDTARLPIVGSTSFSQNVSQGLYLQQPFNSQQSGQQSNQMKYLGGYNLFK